MGYTRVRMSHTTDLGMWGMVSDVISGAVE